MKLSSPRTALSLFVSALVALTTLTAPVHAQSTDLLEQLQRFNKILTLVKHNYVDTVSTESLIDGAIEGLLDDLDPHTNYLKPDVNKRMQELNSGEYSGIGISFEIIDGVLTVISPIEGSPSWDLGIRAGDRIVEIEGENAVGIDNAAVYEKLRGPEGSKVRVGIERVGREDLIHFTIERSKIAIKSVSHHFMLDDQTGYIRANRFSAHTAEELEDALNALSDEGMERLLLDLRGNTGGYLNQAISVADKFLSGGKLVVYTKGRIRGSSEEYFSTENATHPDFPLVVMINEGSASASEIVSGAIQDWDRGLVVGTTSFGKGLVQRQFPIRGGGALLLTVAKYYTPSGRLIQRPYDDRDRTQYLREAGAHLDERGEDESLEVEPDPDVEAELLDEERPTFHTAAGRPVFGGGGISPDVVIDPDYTLTDTQIALLSGAKKYFFNFANDFVGRQENEFSSYLEFADGWHLTDDLFDSFKSEVLSDVAAEDAEVLTAESIDAERDFIDHWMRVELAGNQWGPTARYRLIILDDEAVQSAMSEFPKAEMLSRGDIEAFLELMARQQ
jgi:carboxyl-terminal processing protease